MKKRHYFALLLNVAAIASGLYVVPSWAQTTETETPVTKSMDAVQAARWEQLQRVNAPAKSVHAVWHCVRRIKGRPNSDPEARAQSMMESARKRGLDEAKVAQLGDIARKAALGSQKYREIESTFDFVRIGNSVLCNAVQLTPELNHRWIEFSDGIDSIRAINEFEGEIRKPSGILQRDSEEILSMSATGTQVARFLLAIPFDQEFGPDNPMLSQEDAKLSQSIDGEWLVERKTRDERDARGEQSQVLSPNTLTFGGDGAYISSYEELVIKGIRVSGSGKNQKVEAIDYESSSKLAASEFKQYAGGIWFPSRIVRTSPDETYKYDLIEAQFNDDVDPMGLTLPPDLRVTDVRFIAPAKYEFDRRLAFDRRIVVYTTTEGRLMTDDEVIAKRFAR